MTKNSCLINIFSLSLLLILFKALLIPIILKGLLIILVGISKVFCPFPLNSLKVLSIME